MSVKTSVILRVCLFKSHSFVFSLWYSIIETPSPHWETCRYVSACCLVIEPEICCDVGDVNSKGQHALVCRARWKVTTDEAFSAWALSVDFAVWNYWTLAALTETRLKWFRSSLWAGGFWVGSVSLHLVSVGLIQSSLNIAQIEWANRNSPNWLLS